MADSIDGATIAEAQRTYSQSIETLGSAALVELFQYAPPVLETVHIALSSAEILALGTTPLIIVPPQGALIVPVLAVFEYIFGTTDYTPGATNSKLAIGFELTSGALFNFAFPAAGANSWNLVSPNGGAAGLALADGSENDIFGRALVVTTSDGANPTGGDGTMLVGILYYNVTGPSGAIEPTPPEVTAPVNTAAPHATIAEDNLSASVTNGTWTGTAPITYTYQWYIDSPAAAITGATSSSYTFAGPDAGKTNLYCVVTGTNDAGHADALSNALTVPS